MINLETWLTENNLQHLIEPLKTNEIDFELLLELTEDDLKELGLILGARKRLLKAIASAKAASKRAPISSQHETPPAGRSKSALEDNRAERRHLTVMFADLVGSTALSTRLDPEDFQTIVLKYRDSVASIVGQYGGHIATFLGDGVLCFFGWPKAQEDDAERAVRAGFEISRAIRSIGGIGGERLEVRVGIASGVVVIGDLIGQGAAQKEGVYGETPNLAARLQQLAKPGQVLISEATSRLVGRMFDLERLGPFELKGVDGTATAFLITAVRDLESRFQARLPRSAPKMIGRDAELAILKERWSRAKGSNGQCLIINGEAGIGKSRLIEALVKAIECEPCIKILYQCSPHHSASPLYPVVRQLSRASEISQSDNSEEKLAKLEAILRGGGIELFAQLLGIEPHATNDRILRDARQLRLRTLKALTDEMVTLSRSEPLLLIVEDAHWIDPTTLELINLALGRITNERIFFLITARPDFRHGFDGNPMVNWLSLSRLSSRDIRAIVSQCLGGKRISADILQVIESRCDGIPLFIEEITNALIQSENLTDTASSHLETTKIPATLQDSLMARIDRLNVAKEITQTAACIGREFSADLLRKLINVDDASFTRAIDQLVGAEIVFQHTHARAETYIFKHALVRDAAYSSLLKRRRRKIHAQILAVLEADRETGDEILAKHAAEAGELEKSIALWRSAARLATGRCAYHEAANHLEAAIALIAKLGKAPDLQEQALEMLGWLAFTWISAEGYMSERARDAAQRGVQLARQLPRSRHRFAPHYAEWTLLLATGPQDEALARIEAVVTETDTPDGAFHRFFANAFAAYSCLAVGRLEQADMRLEAACRAYKPERHNRGSDRFGHIPGPDMFYRFGFLRLLQGRLDEAADYLDRAHECCPSGIDIHAEAQLLMKTALVALFLRDFTRLEAYTDRLRAIADEFELPLAQINADLYQAPLMVARGDAAGARLFASASERYETQIMIYLSAARWLAQADLLLRAGLREDAASACDHAGSLIKKTGETLAEPELYRLRAELASAEGNDDQAAENFRKAIDVARAQGTGLWELRATKGLMQLLARRGRNDEATALLLPIYEQFTQGRDRPDLLEAASLFKALISP